MKPFIKQSLIVVADKYGPHSLYRNSCRAQTGVVLVISLIILLLLTLIGLSAMQTTSLEEKMAGNFRDKNLAFHVAESALRVAENSLPSILSSAYNPACTGGLCSEIPSISLADNAILSDSFWINNPVATSSLTRVHSETITY